MPSGTGSIRDKEGKAHAWHALFPFSAYRGIPEGVLRRLREHQVQVLRKGQAVLQTKAEGIAGVGAPGFRIGGGEGAGKVSRVQTRGEVQEEGGIAFRKAKPGKVRELIRDTTGRITKKEIMARCPDVSQKTVERALRDLLDNNEIIKIGGGRYTSYTWNWERE